MVSFDPQVKNNLFTQVSSINMGEQQYAPVSGTESPEAGYEQYGTGKGINGTNSNGFLGFVEGTGENGAHRLNMYM